MTVFAIFLQENILSNSNSSFRVKFHQKRVLKFIKIFKFFKNPLKMYWTSIKKEAEEVSGYSRELKFQIDIVAR